MSTEQCWRLFRRVQPFIRVATPTADQSRTVLARRVLGAYARAAR